MVFFEQDNVNTVRIQMWDAHDAENYTLDWEYEVTPGGDSGRTVVSVVTSCCFLHIPHLTPLTNDYATSHIAAPSDFTDTSR